MSVEAIRAGKAFVEFFIEDSGVDPALDRIQKGLLKFGAIATAVAAPIVATFTKALSTFVSVGSELEDLHRRTGLSASSLSELAYAAQQSGVEMSVLEQGIKELQSKGVDPKQFDAIADGIAAIPDHTARAQRAIETFGKRTGVALLPLLEDLPALREEARRLNVVMSDQSVAAADKLGDAWSAVKSQMTALGTAIGEAVAPAFEELLKIIQPILSAAIEFVRENPKLVAAVALVSGVLAGAATAALSVAAALPVLNAALGVTATLSAALLIEWAPVVLVAGAIALAIYEVVSAISEACDWIDKLENAITDVVTWPARALWGEIKAVLGIEGSTMQSDLSGSMSGANVQGFSAPELAAIAATGGLGTTSAGETNESRTAEAAEDILRFLKSVIDRRGTSVYGFA